MSGESTLRTEIDAIIDGLYYEVYKNSGLVYGDENVAEITDKIMKAIESSSGKAESDGS